MLFDSSIAQQVAEKLLQVEALRINVKQPFRWSAGWWAPVYCDNRRTLSFPDVRTFLRDQFVALIRRHFPAVQSIAAVATAGIAHGVLIADVLHLPFCYVRPKPKEHGLQQQIEGILEAGSRVVVVEDLLSTGSSSAQVIDVLVNAGAHVEGLVAIFDYDFEQAHKTLQQKECVYFTLSNLGALLQAARHHHRLTDEEWAIIKGWQQQPDRWLPDYS
ncbi:MAG: orotate phosphoribosyltransferase [Chitinophagales bacterium]|nr:orotate phosphoribosyltransferase [Chitinophagales bacterium]MDW8427374.1 orotate phosphoribosyltransferase [Chitinophagales bacterium]